MNKETRVLIIGAGEAGEMAVSEMFSHPELLLVPIAFVDDDPQKQGKKVKGIPVLGGREEIAGLAGKLSIDEILIAIPSATGKDIRTLARYCEKAKVRFKIVPGIREIIRGDFTINQIRTVESDDLLGRETVEVDQSSLRNYLLGKKILITGAGGSIGSEILKRVLSFEPEEVVLFGRGENSIFEAEADVRLASGKTRLLPVIADLKERRVVEKTVSRHKPDVVFHAAAHKHVHLMELHPVEAVKNNLLGTKFLIDSCIGTGTERFVMLSTDKAVSPACVMGATKKLAEFFLGERAKGTHSTKLMAVRFGNVLGTRGSVVPVFKKQISQGGPVTVSDASATRYFMTVKEAVLLVLQAGAIGTGGEVFVLDMGEPVRILDLARELITFSGFVPEVEIQITFSGLRPGEKLTEALWEKTETIRRTEHQKILVVTKKGELPFDLDKEITEIERLCATLDDQRVLDKLKELVPPLGKR
ncbi:MAG: nucleoside-diphosphate sugar epimerase/dehydratase [Candidatus Eisenbacteria bacterium]|nr:nucleoside-diphosphate sugar epimerase/dehydratase [Candidatus Eisenbacteria bacterium]